MHLFPHPLVTLAYHMVSDCELDHVKYYRYKTPAMFRNDVRYVVEHHDYMKRVGTSELTLPTTGSRGNRFVFTIDDGFAEGFDVIRPILKQFDVGAIFFITTDFLDDRSIFFESLVSLCLSAIEKLSSEQASELLNKLRRSDSGQPADRLEERDRTAARRLQDARIQRPRSPSHAALYRWCLGLEHSDVRGIEELCDSLGVDWRGHSDKRRLFLTSEQVRVLANEGFAVGAHGVTHASFRGADVDVIEREMVESGEVIRALTGQAIVPFAFPYGARDLRTPQLREVLAKHKHIFPLFDTGGIRPISDTIIDRLIVDSPDDACGDESNLPVLLHNAWSRRSAWMSLPR